MEMGNLYGMDFLVLKRVPILSQRKENGDSCECYRPRRMRRRSRTKLFEVFSFLGEQGSERLVRNDGTSLGG